MCATAGLIGNSPSGELFQSCWFRSFSGPSRAFSPFGSFRIFLAFSSLDGDSLSQCLPRQSCSVFALFMVLQYVWLLLRATVLTALYAISRSFRERDAIRKLERILKEGDR